MPMLSFELKSCSESIAFTPALKSVRLRVCTCLELVILVITESVKCHVTTK